MDLLARGVDVIEGVLRYTEEALAFVELKHLPEGLRGLTVLIGMWVIDEISADDEHCADVMDLLDELSWEMLVMRYKLSIGFGCVDLSKNGT